MNLFSKMAKKRKIELQEHQKRVSKKMKASSKGRMLFHSLGSGKTISAINSAKELGLPLLAIVPASLRNNFEKEIKKVGFKGEYRVVSYTKATKLMEDEDFRNYAARSLVVYDEAHRMGRIGTQRSKLTKNLPSKKVIMLTGTPFRNRPEEMVPLMKAFDVAGFPKDTDQFKLKYIKEKLVKPGLWGRLWHGAKAGIEEESINMGDFKEKVKGVVDFHESFDKKYYPDVKESLIKVPMSWRQNSAYQYMIGKMPALRYKLIHGIPPDKKEKGRMTSFLMGPRQVGNTPVPFSTSATEADARKIQEAADEIEKRYKSDKNFKGVSYSSFLDTGVKALSRELNKRGIDNALFTGELNDKKKKKVIEDYNGGKTPVLLVSKAGTEGLDLKGTKLVQILEPHWNEGQIKQIKGRAIRYRSHDHLPEKERVVEVQRFHSIVPRTIKQRIFNSKRDKSADEYIYDLAMKKEKLNIEFLKAMAESAIEEDRNMEKGAGIIDALKALRGVPGKFKSEADDIYRMAKKTTQDFGDFKQDFNRAIDIAEDTKRMAADAIDEFRHYDDKIEEAVNRGIVEGTKNTIKTVGLPVAGISFLGSMLGPYLARPKVSPGERASSKKDLFKKLQNINQEISGIKGIDQMNKTALLEKLAEVLEKHAGVWQGIKDSAKNMASYWKNKRTLRIAKKQQAKMRGLKQKNTSKGFGPTSSYEDANKSVDRGERLFDRESRMAAKQKAMEASLSNARNVAKSIGANVGGAAIAAGATYGGGKLYKHLKGKEKKAHLLEKLANILKALNPKTFATAARRKAARGASRATQSASDKVYQMFKQTTKRTAKPTAVTDAMRSAADKVKKAIKKKKPDKWYETADKGIGKLTGMWE